MTSKVSASELSIKDFVNLLITIGVITPDKIPSVNAFLLTLETQSTSTDPIYDITVKAESNSARVNWKTSTSTESKVFIEGKTYFSKRGIGTVHYVDIGGLESELEYSGTISAISNSSLETKKFSFTTGKTPLKITLVRQNCPNDSCILGWETNYKTDSKIKIYKKSNNELVKMVVSPGKDDYDHQVEFKLEPNTEYIFKIYANDETESVEISGQFKTAIPCSGVCA